MIAVFLAALAATLLLTPGVRFLARRTGVIARPRTDRWNERPTALLGGIAIAGGFAAGVGVAIVGLDAPLTGVVSRSMLGIVLSAAAMFAIGLLDDRLKFRPATKLILQGVAAAILVGFGVVYPLTPWYSVNVLVTLFWFFGLTNALNLLDNMDGVATGVAAVAALFLAATFAWRVERVARGGVPGGCGGRAGLSALQLLSGVHLHGGLREPLPRRDPGRTRSRVPRPGSREHRLGAVRARVHRRSSRSWTPGW